MKRTKWIAVIFIAVIARPVALHAQIRTDFSQQWVRTHPFQIIGWANSVDGGSPDPLLFGPSGCNTILVHEVGTMGGGEDTIASHSALGHPWHFYINATSLNQTVQDRVNYLYGAYPYSQGWYIDDEPNCDTPTSPDLLGMADVSGWLKSQYPDHLIYANILAYTTDNMYKVDNYVNVVEPDVLMYDWYPFSVGYEAKVNDHFNYAMAYREKGLQFGIPYFSYLQAIDNASHRPGSESEMRWDAFSKLTMGYKGLAYYHYSCDTYSGLVDGTTSTTTMYDIAAVMNPEISNLGNVLTYSTSTDVRYIRGPIGRSAPSSLNYWSSGAGSDTHITNIKVLDYGYEKNGLIGFFEDDNGEELFMLTNLNHGSTLNADDATVSFEITFDNSIDSLLCWDRTANQQTVISLNNHVLEVDLPGGTGNLYKYDNGENFIHYLMSMGATLDVIDNGCPETGLHSYTLTATGCGITTLSKFSIDGEIHQVFDADGKQSEWLGDGSASGSEKSDSYVIFGDLRLPDLGDENWDWDEYPDGPPDKVTLETIDGEGNSGLGTLNNYNDNITPIWDAYFKIGTPSGEETVELLHIVVPDGNGFSVDLSLVTSEYFDSSTGESLVTTHDLSFSLPTLIAGDANGDGFVDTDDALILAQHWLQQSDATWAMCDFNRDGAVNDIDATMMAANWTGSSSASVPEPGMMALLAGIGIAAFCLLRTSS